MSRKIKTTFTLKSEPSEGGRLGEIHFGKRGIIKTPALFPAICIMTGPPGFGRNGAHYKYIKRQLSLDWKFTQFMTEILHFTDYMSTRNALDRWLERPFQVWMDEMMRGKGEQGDEKDFDYNRQEKPYEACFLLDSGGFKLLGNRDFSIEKFGYSTSTESILSLQTGMGGDIIASLDYPLPPVEYSPESLRELQEKSIKNCIKLLQILSLRRKRDPKPLAYLAVHGIDYETTRDYMERLLKFLDKEGDKYPSFGFAIGSLVPRRSKRALVASIVKAVKDAILEHKNGIYNEKPIHAFGMSGDLMPTLTFLGVDTFDSNSFVQSGKNLKYVLPDHRMTSGVRETRSLLELSEKDLIQCGCRACKKCEKENLLHAYKKVSRLARDKPHDLGVGRDLIKSEAYSFLALHNLEIELRQLDKVRHHIQKNTLGHYVLQYAEKSNNRSALIQAYEAATGKIIAREKGRKVSLDLTREAFAIPDTYRPPKGKGILLFLPCTKDKPYKKSRSHEIVRSAFHKDSRIHIVTISGLYGPVPEEFEEEPEIMEYDYMLSPEAKDQMAFVIDRVVSFLKLYGNYYRQIFAYTTVKAYREVARLALKQYGRGILLPTKLKERTSKEFLKHENIVELQRALGPYFPGSSFSTEQLTFDFDSAVGE